MTSPFATYTTDSASGAYGYRIWMAGDYDDAKRVCREVCAEKGACYSITPHDFIYSGGEEAGFCVTVLNYPRFPKTPQCLSDETASLAHKLMLRLGQGSYTIEGYGQEKNVSIFYSRRKND